MKNASAKPPVQPHPHFRPLELGCAAGSLASLRAAVDNGADSIYLAFRPYWTGDRTIFTDFSTLKKGISYAHARRRKVSLDVPSSIPPDAWRGLCHLIAEADSAGIDALSFSDPAVMLYCANNHPHLPLHYAVPQERLHPAAIRDLHVRFGVSRVILPPVCSLALIEQLRNTHVEVEVQVYGKSSAIIGPRTLGEHTSSPVSALPAVQGNTNSFLEERLIPGAISGQANQCAIDETASNDFNYANAASHDSSTLALIPKLARLGVRAIHVDSSQHDTANIARVTRVWHEAVNACYVSPTQYAVKPGWVELLNRCSKHSHAR